MAGDGNRTSKGAIRGRRGPGRLLRLVRLRYVQRRLGSSLALALFAFLNGALSIALLSLLAMSTRSPFIFPSLGPTAFLLFYRPLHPSSSPRNVFLGHLIGVVAGWSSLAVFGLLDAPMFLEAGVSAGRVGAAALSLGLTSGVMVLFRTPHAPAGATTLIVSLGLMPHLSQLAVLMGAVTLLVLQAIVINRLAGVPYPAPAYENSARTGIA